MQQPMPIEIYVNPVKGDDTAAGNSMHPFKTLTHALRQASPGTMVQLGRGTYNVASGEQFPLVIRKGISVIGNVAAQGLGVVLEGSGDYKSPAFGPQNVTLVLEDGAELRGVTVTNSTPKGTGVWIESTAPTVSGCTLAKCGREGILVTGTANPSITNCTFQENGASGLTLVRDARGEVRNSFWRQNGFGIAISDRAAPAIVSNQIGENRCGIIVSGTASPVLRSNVIAQNSEDGLVVLGNAMPDLGKQHDPAGNRIRDNQRFDLRNATALTVTLIGNQLNPARINGMVDFLTSRTPYAIPAVTSPQSTRSQSAISTSFLAPSYAPSDLQQHWATALIQPLLDQRILQHEGNFQPEASITAAEFAAWMQAALGQDLPERDLIKPSISDASSDASPLMRLQTVVALVNALKLTGGHPSVLRNYPDRAQVPSIHTLTVATAIQHRLLVSSLPDRLNLLQWVTRAEAAAMLYQALVIQGKASPIDLPQILAPASKLPNFSQPMPIEPVPVVVLDPAHGGADTGVTTKVESVEAAMQEMPIDLQLENIPMSPLPAGAMTMPPDMSGMPGMPPGFATMPSGMPPGMPPDAQPQFPEELSEMPSLQEKNITLSVAQAVAGFLQQQGIKVVLTRSDDRELTLAERVAIAQQNRADAFISLHANANLANNPDINGIETYYNPALQEGARLAWSVHKTLTRNPDIIDRGVHAATFYPLRQLPIASAHVEVGYITGSKDAPSLANLAYHRYLGRAIANGILRYVKQKGK